MRLDKTLIIADTFSPPQTPPGLFPSWGLIRLRESLSLASCLGDVSEPDGQKPSISIP